ncbi:phage shock protein C (PspC) family protein [Maribacter sedimenticola]|uniref:Phage shock protein C (PspC) family protein n=2 Tax=Maribacter TaxID=252356 RepID=A0ABY1SML6_9FLAO|nr:phage shock protein C (PspC) family protein [Maribacter sedimenticola]
MFGLCYRCPINEYKSLILYSMKLFYNLLHYLQKRGFEVCGRIAERLGIRARVVRTSFIYLTFVTVGFGFALYLFLAFWLRIKDLIYTKRNSVFDL